MQNPWRICNQFFTVFYIKDFFPYSINLNYRNFTSHGFLEKLWHYSLFMTGQMRKTNEHWTCVFDQTLL